MRIETEVKLLVGTREQIRKQLADLEKKRRKILAKAKRSNPAPQ